MKGLGVYVSMVGSSLLSARNSFLIKTNGIDRTLEESNTPTELVVNKIQQRRRCIPWYAIG